MGQSGTRFHGPPQPIRAAPTPRPHPTSSSRTQTARPKADAWEALNRLAFQEGYRETPGVEALVPTDRGDFHDALKAWELDIGAWSNDECEYKIYVDDIGFI